MPDHSNSEDIDLRKLIASVWAGKWILASTSFVCAAIAIIYALSITPIYRAEALVQLRDNGKPGGLAALATQLGGGADLLGLLGGVDSDRALTLATLQSRALIQPFLKDHNILPAMFDDLWDAQAQRWTVDDPQKVPSLWLGHKRFVEDFLEVSEDKKTGLVTIAVLWRDPDTAAAWTTDLIARANAYLREKAIHESERNLAYLQEQLKQTGQVELQQSAYALVESEMKKLMLAKGNDEYAIKTIDPAQPPKRRFKPRRVLIAIAGLAFGLITGFAIIYLRSELTPRPRA